MSMLPPTRALLSVAQLRLRQLYAIRSNASGKQGIGEVCHKVGVGGSKRDVLVCPCHGAIVPYLPQGTQKSEQFADRKYLRNRRNLRCINDRQCHAVDPLRSRSPLSAVLILCRKYRSEERRVG